MKKLLLAGLSLLLMSGVAFAGWNLRQKSDGGAYWTNDRDGREEHVLVTHLIVDITNVTYPVSAFVVSPITGIIERIYGVLSNSITGGNAVISFFTSPLTTGGFTVVNAINEVTNGVSKFTFLYGTENGATVSAAGDTVSFTPNSATPNRVTKGGRIGIHADGGPTNVVQGVVARFTIVINPK